MIEAVCATNLKETLWFINFSKAFDSRHSGENRANTSSICLPKEIVTAVMMLYRKMRAKIHSSDEDTDFFNIVVGVLQGDALAPYLFIICLDYLVWMLIDLIKEYYKKKSRWYPAETMKDTNYADNLVLLTSTCDQAESLLLSLEQAAGGIGHYISTNKTEYMCC